MKLIQFVHVNRLWKISMDAFSFATQLNANEMKIIQISTSLNFWFRNRDVTCNNIKLLHQIYLKQNCLRNLILSFSVYKRWKFYHFWWNVRESVCLKKWIFSFCWYDSSNCLIRNSYLDIVMCAKCNSTNVYNVHLLDTWTNIALWNKHLF